MADLILALIATVLVIAAIVTALVLLRIAIGTRQLRVSPTAAPIEKAARRLLGA